MKRTLATIITLFIAGVIFAQDKKWTLEECIAYAMDNNIAIKQAELDVEATDIDRKDAFGAFLPSANANASHSWNIGLNQNITTGLLENQTTQFTALGANVGVDIYSGLQNQNRMRRANLAQIAGKYQLQKMQEDIALNVANAYLQILFNIENLKVQKEQLEINNKQLDQSSQLVDAGMIPRGDLLEIKATIAASEQRVVNSENALLISKLSLAQLIQLEDFKNFDVETEGYEVEETPLLLQSPEAIYEKSKETRTELKIAETNVEIAERDFKIARGAYQPRLTGFYSFNTRAGYADRIVGVEPDPDNPTSSVGFVESTGEVVVSPNFRPVLGNPESVWDQFDLNKGQSFGLQLTVPIFNGFATRNNVQRSKINIERSKLIKEQTELDLELNVYTAFTDVNGALNAYEAALSTLESREEAFRYAQERYDVGMMNAFEYNQASTLLANAQSDVLNAKYDYIFRVKILEFYFGIPIIKE
tara:strand:- start:12220 stop:13650 length:1431 start_codon:yes stop_codon:yes gene_type:complete